MKNCKSGDFRYISSIFSWKKMTWLRHVLASLIRIFEQKMRKNNDEISRKCPKADFPGIFPAFSAGKKCFYKIGLRHLLALPFRISVQIFLKKYKVQLEKFKKCHFSGENRLFRGFLESSIDNLTMLLMVDIVIDNVWVKKQRNKEKVRWKSAKTAISGIFPVFLTGKKIFWKMGLGHVLSNPNMHLWTKNLEKMPKNRFFWYISGIFPAFSARKKCFSKIRLRHILDIAILHLCAKFHE